MPHATLTFRIDNDLDDPVDFLTAKRLYSKEILVKTNIAWELVICG